jgi:hypothetical protein
MKTLYDIDVNPGMLWDYEFSREKLNNEEFFVFYLGRLLDAGTADEVRRIPREVIAQYLDRLSLSSRVRKFWEWYLSQH